ncbi:hypothetical protein [Clostridium estertheticum]|uniref:hypothetical protein n=1 Tax=Clostridium estertheticum TaxID=238834 RepID=UPI002714F04F|nr:hypothetical protein [Clostridium estertheticum]WLC78404.1 hypothetical protein KTC98_14360 [Clostridium estertheticum]
MNYKKWLYTFVMLFVLGILLKYIAPGDCIPKGAPLVFWDYLFIYFSYPLVMILVIPIIYSYLIGDIFTRDCEGGYIEFFLSRISNRVSYFISKVAIVFITSNLLFLCCLINIIIISFVYKLPFKGKYYYEVVTFSIKSGNNIITTLAIQYGLFILTLSTLGLFILIISLIFNNSFYSFIGVILLVLQGLNVVFRDQSKIYFSPMAQGIVSLHSPFCFYGISGIPDPTFQNFTINYSINYLEIMLVLLFAIGCFRIRNMNISRKG